MPIVDAVVSTPTSTGFRVQQIAGMFDVPIEAKSTATFSVEVPDESEAWTIGAIVGPSGSGKSTIARAAFGERLYTPTNWPKGAAVVDGFGDVPTRQITQTLTAVGFSSPPAWVRPYATCSNGERFRCDLARALLTGGEVVAFDEFTSVVDRTVARVGSAAVAKAIRRGRVPVKRFVAVTCHYDILDWLEPDWVVDMATCQLARGRLHRPSIRLEIVRCKQDAWRLFRRHHYLSGALNPAAQCYLGLWAGEPVCFVAVVPVMGRRGCRRVARIVTLPDYQGLGIGSAMTDAVARRYVDAGHSISCTTGHPAMIRHLQRSPKWRVRRVKKTGARRHRGQWGRATVSAGRAVVSFAYSPRNSNSTR